MEHVVGAQQPSASAIQIFRECLSKSERTCAKAATRAEPATTNSIFPSDFEKPAQLSVSWTGQSWVLLMLRQATIAAVIPK